MNSESRIFTFKGSKFLETTNIYKLKPSHSLHWSIIGVTGKTAKIDVIYEDNIVIIKERVIKLLSRTEYEKGIKENKKDE